MIYITTYTAAKYYSDLMDNQDSERTRAGSGIVPSHGVQHSVSQYRNTAAMTSDFESTILEYGQSVLFDKEKEQYFADISSGEKRHVLINLHISRITEYVMSMNKFFFVCCLYDANECDIMSTLNRIDTVRERFRCQFWISFSWLPTYGEWLDYKEHKQMRNLMEWTPAWIPIITFPELINQWKMHFAEKPNSGKFQLSRLHGKADAIGYGMLSLYFSIVVHIDKAQTKITTQTNI